MIGFLRWLWTGRWEQRQSKILKKCQDLIDELREASKNIQPAGVYDATAEPIDTTTVSGGTEPPQRESTTLRQEGDLLTNVGDRFHRDREGTEWYSGSVVARLLRERQEQDGRLEAQSFTITNYQRENAELTTDLTVVKQRATEVREQLISVRQQLRERDQTVARLIKECEDMRFSRDAAIGQAKENANQLAKVIQERDSVKEQLGVCAMPRGVPGATVYLTVRRYEEMVADHQKTRTQLEEVNQELKAESARAAGYKQSLDHQVKENNKLRAELANQFLRAVNTAIERDAKDNGSVDQLRRALETVIRDHYQGVPENLNPIEVMIVRGEYQKRRGQNVTLTKEELERGLAEFREALKGQVKSPPVEAQNAPPENG